MPSWRKLSSARLALAVFAALAAAVSSAPAAAQTPLRAQVQNALSFVEQRLLHAIDEIDEPDRYPKSTNRSTGRWTTSSSDSWTSGFFPGQLWLVYEYTGNEALRTAAEAWTAGLDEEASRTDTHDVGFMILTSFGQAFRITGSASYQQTVLTAAASLDTRFDPDVGATQSWDRDEWEFPVIIDNMMNLELLFWGSRNTANPAQAATWFGHAVSHADVTAASHVRPDGSTYQLVDFDAGDGSILSRETVQGYGDETTWSRGQAWGLYGFTMVHRETGEPRFLAVARTLADWFVAHLPPDAVPYWDFQAPGIPNEPRDSSAAAIAASGLLELSQRVGDPVERERYFGAAEAILASLLSDAYLSDGVESSGILLHGTGNRPRNREVDVSLIYGDYYFTEALLRYLDVTTPACSNGVDDDADGLADFPTDPGCDVAEDASERSPLLPCDDGLDGDGDGFTDYVADANGDGISDPPGDPACHDPRGAKERTQCQDGIDNDARVGTDFDAGVSILGAGHGDPSGPDPECVGRPWRDREASRSCGLGFELAPALAALVGVARRRGRSAARGRGGASIIPA